MAGGTLRPMARYPRQMLAWPLDTLTACRSSVQIVHAPLLAQEPIVHTAAGGVAAPHLRSRRARPVNHALSLTNGPTLRRHASSAPADHDQAS